MAQPNRSRPQLLGADWLAALDADGFALLPGTCAAWLPDLMDAVERAHGASRGRSGGVYAIRNLLAEAPVVAAFAGSAEARTLVEPVVGALAMPVRGLLFNKTGTANWRVPWHQDLTIAVRERVETPNFQAWTTKAGVTHVQPPVSILENMVTLRVHLDPCGADNGPLRVIPGSHLIGRLSAEEVSRITAQQPSVEVVAAVGDVLVMRPLLLHASSSAASPKNRRIIHIEYAAGPLPGGLEWHGCS